MKNAIRYKVTVSAVVERVETVGKDWTKTGQRIEEENPVDVYGYTPEINKTVRRDVQIYEQLVDALDMAALVSVVNGLAK